MAIRVSGKDGNARRIMLGVAVLAPLLTLIFSLSPFAQQIEKDAYDKWFAYRGEREPSEEIVIVAIDVNSEQAIGRYPWERTWHAHLIRNLAEAGARVVVFDATFGDAFPEHDPELLRAIEESGLTVLGAKSLVITDRRARANFPELEEPVGELSQAPYGIVDVLLDPLDNVVREYPITHYYGRDARQVPQLGLRALQIYLGMDTGIEIEEEAAGWHFAGRFIPRGPLGGMLINYRGFGDLYTRYAYMDVVDDAETWLGDDWDLDSFEDLKAEGRFQDKMVFVGTVVPEHQDSWPTPFVYQTGSTGASLTAGVEVHANAVDTILRQDFIHAAPGWLNLLIVVVLGVGVSLLATRLKAIWGAVLSLGLLLLVMIGAYLLFSRALLWIWSFTPTVAIGLAYLGSTVSLYVLEQQDKARIRSMFQQYVPPRVVNELIANPHLLSLGGEERELTVLFSDVASFTSISEDLSPTDLVGLLNEYLTAMTEIVVEHDGIIDKYEGDALMAEFGAPIPFEDHAVKACLAAISMQRKLTELRTKWEKEGRPPLTARIGINTGIMLVGNMGSRHIMDYTVMGDNVNLASRLEGTNKVYGTKICVSESTHAAAIGEVITRELDLIRVKGKSRPVHIYEVFETVEQGIPAGRASMLERFEMGLQFFRDRRFTDALELFSEIHEMDPDDGPAALYARRCQQYVETPPPDDWDGVFIMTTK